MLLTPEDLWLALVRRPSSTCMTAADPDNVSGVRIAMYAVLRQRGHDPVKLDPWHYPSVDAYRDVRFSRVHP